MCGIAGFLVREPGSMSRQTLELLARELLAGIASRGGDATGLLALSDSGERLWRKASCNSWDFVSQWRAFPERTSLVLLHTRFATQGHEAFPENNHPLRRGDFYVVHNGHVWNDSELLPAGERHGSVDSEAIAYLLEQGDSLELTSKTLQKLRGDAAVGIADARRPDALTIARGIGSPLSVHESGRLTAFASTSEALSGAWLRTFGGRRKRLLGTLLAEGEIRHYRGNAARRIERVKLSRSYSWDTSYAAGSSYAAAAASSYLSSSERGSWKRNSADAYAAESCSYSVADTCDGCELERYTCEGVTVEGIYLNLCIQCRREVGNADEKWHGSNLTL
jgi:predicted glutamine amidotransferase